MANSLTYMRYKPTGASQTAHADVNLITKTATTITAKLDNIANSHA